MRIYVDQGEGGQSKVPKFRVELRNAGEKDLLLNLGIMARGGKQQYPTAVSLILIDARSLQRLELNRPCQVVDAEKETLYLPLPVGASFSFPVDLDNYWVVTSKESDYKLKPGTYWLAAHLNGFIRKAQRSNGTVPWQTAPVYRELVDLETWLSPRPYQTK
jgi:hypothetical protein